MALPHLLFKQILRGRAGLRNIGQQLPDPAGDESELEPAFRLLIRVSFDVYIAGKYQRTACSPW